VVLAGACTARWAADYRISRGLTVPVSRMDEVLARAMTRKPEPIEWDETTTTAAAVPEEVPVEEGLSPPRNGSQCRARLEFCAGSARRKGRGLRDV
jgi:hypothetical protein